MPFNSNRLAQLAAEQGVVDPVALTPNSCRDSAVPVTTFVLVKERTYAHFQARILVTRLQNLLLIVESAACQTGDLEEARERVTLP